MVKPSDFILNTDYATLKNDAGTTVSVLLPGSIVVPGSSTTTFSFDTSIGVRGALNRVQIASSKDSNNRYATTYLQFLRTGIVLATPATYTILGFAFRSSPLTLRCIILVPNPYSDPLTTEAGDETFTFYIDTFIPPYA